MRHIPPPSPQHLLPPLLACLPTAFASPRAPPALLPLLSPILRQRVQFIPTTPTSTSTSTSSFESWLPLLCWEKEAAQQLVDLVSESDAFELHPVSGEIDYGDVDKPTFRRLDEETLQARLVIPTLRLTVVYLWCPDDAEGGAGADGWRVSEVTPLDENNQMERIPWTNTITSADAQAQDRSLAAALRHGEANSVGAPAIQSGTTSQDHSTAAAADNDDDDADYWARYDSTPGGRTPALTPGPKQSPLPSDQSRPRSTSEAEYYARYAQVQPEMEHDDPDEDRAGVGESTVNGDALASVMGMGMRVGRSRGGGGGDDGMQGMVNGNGNGQQSYGQQSNGRRIDAGDEEEQDEISQPRSAPSPISVQRLEDSAELQSVAEVAIRQHVSTNVKSLFRLCRSTGMEVEEFGDMVRTELETLSMMEDE